MADRPLSGRVAAVTGASSGIGEATALALAQAGAAVALGARRVDRLEALAARIEEAGGRAIAIECDVADEASAHAFIATTVEQLGGLDLLVNNAGGSFPKPLLETSVKSFEKAFSFNVTTAFELTKQAVPAMLARGEGAVVNISSAAGRLPDRGFSAYGTAKGALTHLTRIMAADLNPHVRVNAIAVGSVATSALEMVLTDDNLRRTMEANTPLRRLGTPEDIAAGVLYLCSPAGSYLTGKILEIDGGIESATLAMGLPDLEPPTA